MHPKTKDRCVRAAFATCAHLKEQQNANNSADERPASTITFPALQHSELPTLHEHRLPFSSAVHSPASGSRAIAHASSRTAPVCPLRGTEPIGQLW